MNVAVETLLAAVVQSQGGVITVPNEHLTTKYEDLFLALDYDQESGSLVITLIDKETAEYEDE